MTKQQAQKAMTDRACIEAGEGEDRDTGYIVSVDDGMATPNEDDWKRAAKICREVAELPDRTSPEDNADFMLVTPEELSSILAEEFAQIREDAKLAS